VQLATYEIARQGLKLPAASRSDSSLAFAVAQGVGNRLRGRLHRLDPAQRDFFGGLEICWGSEILSARDPWAAKIDRLGLKKG
jgi:hypothetical protein